MFMRGVILGFGHLILQRGYSCCSYLHLLSSLLVSHQVSAFFSIWKVKIPKKVKFPEIFCMVESTL